MQRNLLEVCNNNYIINVGMARYKDKYSISKDELGSFSWLPADITLIDKIKVAMK